MAFIVFGIEEDSGPGFRQGLEPVAPEGVWHREMKRRVALAGGALHRK